ncbi:hypothetical protein OSCI_3650017 [Kamptonema sp. PCC 6506]|nr:hypothetical protein [Kamptonema formosum]CBN58159.1 hypothetical protein OSCI_3650017 [Kamptonema sp. PCC 6506]
MSGFENQARDRLISIVYTKKRDLNEPNTLSEILDRLMVDLVLHSDK